MEKIFLVDVYLDTRTQFQNVHLRSNAKVFEVTEDGSMEIAAMVLVGYDAVDGWNLDGETKNRIIESLFVHELTHVKQLLSMGLEKFNKASFSMTEGSNMNDYVNNILEKEVYAKQNEYLKKHNVDIQFGVGGTEGYEFKCSIIFPKFN